MTPRWLLAGLATALVAVLVSQGTAGYYYTDPRTENKAILISMASTPVYDPTALVTVTTGVPGSLSTVTVSQSQAIDMHLDFLDRHHVRLSTTGAATSTSTMPPSDPEPQWPADGKWVFWESGWISAGAVCPSVTPIGPTEYTAKTGQQWPTSPAGAPLVAGGYQYTAGVVHSEVSLHGSKTSLGSVRNLNSQLWRWNHTADPNNPGITVDTANPLAVPDADPDGEWYFGGAYNAGWKLEGTGFTDYWCQRSPAGDKVDHHSIVEPQMARVA
jgi:hypothetical protein